MLVASDSEVSLDRWSRPAACGVLVGSFPAAAIVEFVVGLSVVLFPSELRTIVWKTLVRSHDQDHLKTGLAEAG